MTLNKTRWLLVSLVCLVLWPTAALAQGGPWEIYSAAGVAAYQRGNYAEAEKQFKAALKTAEAFAPQAPRLATSLNNLAAFYHDQSKYAEAEPLYKRALAIWGRALGPQHPGVATSLNNLARLYRAQRRYAEAAPLHKRALTIWEKALGPEHPKVTQSLENYAVLLRKIGRGAEATKMEARVKALRAKRAKEKPAK